MKIVIGNDHGALDLKNEIVEHLESNGHTVENIGVDCLDSVDYPDFANKACTEYKAGNYDFGILVCGTGIGISIAANKINGIRAALLHNLFTAEMAKEHNNANFIVFGGRIEYQVPVIDMIDKFMATEFGGDRHATRVCKIMDLEKN